MNNSIPIYIIDTLIEKYRQEWVKAKNSKTVITKGQYEKVNLKEAGKQEAFTLILDDLVKLKNCKT